MTQSQSRVSDGAEKTTAGRVAAVVTPVNSDNGIVELVLDGLGNQVNHPTCSGDKLTGVSVRA